MRFAPEAWPFVLPWLLAAFVLWYFDRPTWAIAAVVLALATLLFFRDPDRKFHGDASVILAAADGKILAIDEVKVTELGGERYRRVVTFLSVFDVHVQRSPTTGQVIAAATRRGKKVAAFKPEAGEVNEQRLTVIQRPNGDNIGVRQIAGLVARRVVGYLEIGDQIDRGEHLGLIKFGSRVDLLVPPTYIITVAVGDRVRAGESQLAAEPE
jgi:phosphatidylserine decarboxylase